jgi:hypothetical protein
LQFSALVSRPSFARKPLAVIVGVPRKRYRIYE